MKYVSLHLYNAHSNRFFEKCKDNNWRCVPWCDGKTQCLDGSDEEHCKYYKCVSGSTKCANNRQCISADTICDGETNCIDGSDELCGAQCIQSPVHHKTIIRRCSEDSGMCFPIEHFCDRVADCPFGSDETQSECTCKKWNLIPCEIKGKNLCIYKEKSY